MSLWTADIDKFKREFFRVWPLIARLPWSQTAFDIEKAYVCAVLSKLAYLNIPEFEVAAAPSAKLVPCLTYQRLIAQRARFEFERYVQSLELVRVFTHATPYIVVTGIAFPGVIFVALRGTRILHATDVLIDLDFRRIGTAIDRQKMKFHRGFYLEITKNLQPITVKVQALASPDVPVYVVGHSLGGAMAAIFYAVAGRTFNVFNAYENLSGPNMPVHSSYTYGMPRYGNIETMRLPTPLHLFNRRDAIPTVPPSWLGFSNALDEFCLDSGRRSVVKGPRPSASIGAALARLHWARGIRHHFIERYIQRLR